jgi:hypothetical protein
MILQSHRILQLVSPLGEDYTRVTESMNTGSDLLLRLTQLHTSPPLTITNLGHVIAQVVQRRPWLYPRSSHVGFAVENVVFGGIVVPKKLRFPLPIHIPLTAAHSLIILSPDILWYPY